MNSDPQKQAAQFSSSPDGLYCLLSRFGRREGGGGAYCGICSPAFMKDCCSAENWSTSSILIAASWPNKKESLWSLGGQKLKQHPERVTWLPLA